MTQNVKVMPTWWQKVILGVGTTALFLGTSGVAHAAALEQTTKSIGSKVITFLIILAVVLGAICADLGIALMASGNQMLHAAGMKKLLVGLACVLGILCLGLIFTWVVQTITSSHGGFG